MGSYFRRISQLSRSGKCFILCFPVCVQVRMRLMRAPCCLLAISPASVESLEDPQRSEHITQYLVAFSRELFTSIYQAGEPSPRGMKCSKYAVSYLRGSSLIPLSPASTTLADPTRDSLSPTCWSSTSATSVSLSPSIRHNPANPSALGSNPSSSSVPVTATQTDAPYWGEFSIPPAQASAPTPPSFLHFAPQIGQPPGE